jgi:hypothetical protein
MSAAVASYHSAERAEADARRALAAALASADPRAVARAKRLSEAAEEAKRRALSECAAGLMHGEPEEAVSATTRRAVDVKPRAGALAKTEQPASTERPATTGASLQGLALQLRQTRQLVERVKQTASDLQHLSDRPGVPDDLRKEAKTQAAAVEAAIQTFRRVLSASDNEGATQAARFHLEQQVMRIVAAHQSIHLALAALPDEAAGLRAEKPAARTAPPR